MLISFSIYILYLYLKLVKILDILSPLINSLYSFPFNRLPYYIASSTYLTY